MNGSLNIATGQILSGGIDISTLFSGGGGVSGAYLPLSGGTVTGVLSTTNVIYASGGNSNQWNSTYSTVQTNSGSWGGGGRLTIFSEISSITSPNNIVPTFGLSARSLSADVDFAIIPKGSGALLTQMPDGSASGGNKRGIYATDWQRDRIGAPEVASGQNATIGGGGSNTASAEYTTVGGGLGNTASVYAAAIGGGEGNTASSDYATIGGGAGNNASGEYSTIGGGSNNTASVNAATVGGGNGNTASTDYATRISLNS